MKLRLPRRRLWRAAIYLLSFLLVLLAADLVLVHVRREITPGFDTTRIVGPLKADGTIDYVAALDEEFGEGVTPENNAAIPFLQAAGPAALDPTQPTDGITEKLGMPSLPEKGDYFVSWLEYVQSPGHYNDPEPELASTTTTRPTSFWPIYTAQDEAWLAVNKRALDLGVAASKRSRFFIPMNGGNPPESLMDVLLPNLNIIKLLGNAILVRAMIRLQNGDAAGFEDDYLAVFRLDRLLGQSPVLIGRLVAGGMEAGACEDLRFAAASGRLSSRQDKELVLQLAALGELPDLSVGINAEMRLNALAWTQQMAASSPARDVEMMVPFQKFARLSTDPSVSGLRFPGAMFIRFAPIPYEQSMRTVNRLYDGAIVAMSAPTFPQRAAAMDLLNQQIMQIHNESYTSALLSGDFPAQIFVSKFGLAVARERVVMENRLTQLALALAAYKSDHGGYPTALAELAPEYIPAIPIDSFIEKPLIYARTDVGYTLYSVGANMKDDGGKSDKPADDIVASLP